MIIQPGDLDKKEAYKLLISAVVPRPIALVSTVSPDGTPNLAPFSFFSGVSARPPLVSIAVGTRRGKIKDTARNAVETGELVVNVVTEEISDAMNLTSGDYAPEIDEFEVAGLTPAPSRIVRPPRVSESPVSLECRLERALSLAGDAVTLLVAEVLLFHLRDDVLAEDGTIDVRELRPIGRLGGSGYCRVRDVFELVRPKVG